MRTCALTAYDAIGARFTRRSRVQTAGRMRPSLPIERTRSWLRGRVDWQTFRRWERQPNILERDYQLKRAFAVLITLDENLNSVDISETIGSQLTDWRGW